MAERNKAMAHTTNAIGGKYIHFKGKKYDVFCEAIDNKGNKYIFYQQCYGDKAFWLRPRDEFFDKVIVENESVDRFKPISKKREPADSKISELIPHLKDLGMIIKNTENDCEYVITGVYQKEGYISVYPLQNSYCSGYLTEYELARRLGYNLCLINGQLHFHKRIDELKEAYKLKIGNSDSISILKNQMNPCSIDLQIADSGFLCAKRKLVDPQSVEHISSATDLWKKVKPHHSKNQASAYYKLRPGNTILTHTKERIRIPSDCAGKIEIKSTFARLSLSVTSGDFCNPGYDGYFPLEITNNGKHTIIIHENETMVQLMLIPLQGPILNEYSEKATFKNDRGYDDGTPFSFWRERSIKALRQKDGTQQIVDLYDSILKMITSENTDDINAFRERFSNNFLPFCQKKLNKEKNQTETSDQPDAKKLLKAYIARERQLKAFFSFKWVSTFVTIILGILPIVFGNTGNASWLWCLTIPFAILTIWLFCKAPKTFCTFQNIDINTIDISTKINK